jgi:hypothetical protein
MKYRLYSDEAKKRKHCNPEFYIQQKLAFKIEGKVSVLFFRQ